MAEASSSGIGGFIGNSLGEAAAFAAGLAIGPVLRPYLQELENETWRGTPTRPLDAAVVAQGVAEGKISNSAGQNEASLTGIGKTPFATLVTIMKNGPGVPGGLELIRRGQLTPADFVTVLQRAGLEDQFVTAYQEIAVNGLEPWQQPLSPSDIALGIVRSTLPSQGLLVVDLDTSGSNVAQYTPASLDVIAEASASGMDKERLRTLVGNVGLPLATEAAARAQFRGIITKGAFYQAILEGDTRPEWADAIYETAREILTSHDYCELHLRGWITADQMYAGTALHGMTQADTDLLFENLGRPIPVHQVTTGLARGGEYNGDTSQIPEAYLRSMQEGNSRPEWYNLEYANRYTYPSYFVIKPLVASGAITVDEATQIFENEGWPPDLAAKAAQSFAATSSTATATPHLKSAVTSAVTAIKNAYVGGQLTEAEATGYIQQAEAATTVTGAWDVLKTVSALPPVTPIVAPPTGG